VAQFNLGQIREAQETFAKVIRLDPQFAEAQTNLIRAQQ